MKPLNWHMEQRDKLPHNCPVCGDRLGSYKGSVPNKVATRHLTVYLCGCRLSLDTSKLQDIKENPQHCREIDIHNPHLIKVENPCGKAHKIALELRRLSQKLNKDYHKALDQRDSYCNRLDEAEGTIRSITKKFRKRFAEQAKRKSSKAPVMRSKKFKTKPRAKTGGKTFPANSGASWTPKDLKTLEAEHKKGIPLDDIAESLKRTKKACVIQLDKLPDNPILRFPDNHGKPWTDKESKLLDRLQREKWTIQYMAGYLDRTDGAIKSELKRQGFDSNTFKYEPVNKKKVK